MVTNLRCRNKVIDDRKALTWYNAGLTDQQIADNFGVHKETVRNWRRRMGLASHAAEVHKKEKKLTPLERDAIAAREAGMTYGQYKSQQSLAAKKGGRK